VRVRREGEEAEEGYTDWTGEHVLWIGRVLASAKLAVRPFPFHVVSGRVSPPHCMLLQGILFSSLSSLSFSVCVCVCVWSD